MEVRLYLLACLMYDFCAFDLHLTLLFLVLVHSYNLQYFQSNYSIIILALSIYAM